MPYHLPELLLANASSENLHDLLQILDGFRLRFHHVIHSLRPEREVQAGQVGTVCGPVMGISARYDPIVEFRSKEVHDGGGYVTRSAVLVKPVLLPGGSVPHSRPHARPEHLQVRFGVNRTLEPVHRETRAVDYSDPCHHLLAVSFLAWHDVVRVGRAPVDGVLPVRYRCDDKPLLIGPEHPFKPFLSVFQPERACFQSGRLVRGRRR